MKNLDTPDTEEDAARRLLSIPTSQDEVMEQRRTWFLLPLLTPPKTPRACALDSLYSTTGCLKNNTPRKRVLAVCNARRPNETDHKDRHK